MARWPQGRVRALIGGHPELPSCPPVPTGGRNERRHLQPGGGSRRPDLPQPGLGPQTAGLGEACACHCGAARRPLRACTSRRLQAGGRHPPRWHCRLAASIRGHRRRQGPPLPPDPLTATSAEQTPANRGRGGSPDKPAAGGARTRAALSVCCSLNIRWRSAATEAGGGDVCSALGGGHEGRSSQQALWPVT